MSIKNFKSYAAWNNIDNIGYYENIPINIFKEYAALGGFEAGCDIDIFFDYIKQANSILEIGAGYGRVLHNLITRGFRGQISAIERSRNLCTYLATNFSEPQIIHADIRNFEPQQKFSAILWLWNGIADFSKPEQTPILKRIITWLQKDGWLILDTISHNIELAKEFDFHNQSYVKKISFGTAYGYIPSSEEIAEYAQQLGMQIKQLAYHTLTNRPRIIHIMQKIIS